VVSHVVRFLGVTALLCMLLPHVAAAQDRRHPRWEIPGFDFRKDGVLRPQARAVRARRAQLRAAGRFSELNTRVAPLGQAGGPQPSPTQVSGVLKVPAILFRYKDSPPATFLAPDYDAVLFAATPPPGRPYTYRSFYNELSNGVFDIQGATYGYATLDTTEAYYVGGQSSACATQNPYGSTNCNGLFSSLAVSRMQSALTQALGKLDSQIDFSQYVDPASGFVPLVLFMHEAMGGECGPSSQPQNHLWAHRFSLPTYTTQDDWPGHPGQKIKISDYILQPAVGGANSCTTTQIMPIGTVAHETGHGFGLPDLYDTGGQSEGIGQWGLMSSGSFTSPLSPSRMEAWSLNELGWITVVPLTSNGTYTFDAAPLSDTAYYVAVQGSNPRGEYFLLENREPQQSDTALIRIHCARAGNPSGCTGGLLIWHVDQVKLNSGGNAVNTGAIHGLELMQADAFRNLDAPSVSSNFCPLTSMFLDCSNRGDAGDPFPGTTGNSGFVFRTNPASVTNVDGSFSGVAIDFIHQLVTDRTVSFRLRFGALTIARASDTVATITFDGSTLNVFRDLLEQGSSHTVGFGTGQVSPDGRTRWFFSSWSDGGAISHTITGSLAGATLTANLGRQFKLIATATSGGTVTADTAINLSGDFVPDGRAVQLTPTPNAGLRFCGWTGTDTTTTDSLLTLPMRKPFTVAANFGTNAAITSANARPNGVMGATYADTLRISGGGGVTTWTVTGGALPQGLSLSAAGVVSGFPRQSGNYSYTASVSSCDTTSRAFTLSVSVPALATADVTAQLLGPTSPLTPDQVRYLDFQGNNNGSFDIGDFLAWVKATGAPLNAAAMQARQKKGGPR
jgi:M6 family metalloprotease-like protein